MVGKLTVKGNESAHFVHKTNLDQPAGSRSETADPIELADYREQQSGFSNAESNIPLVLDRQQLFPGILARLGRRVIVTNIGAMILLVSAITALLFLWFGGEENKHWRQVMIDGWVGQAVTLSTLAIRLAVSVQTGTAVAMLASVSIEHKPFGGVLLSEAPTLSIARYVNTGPLGCLSPFIRSFQWKLNFLTLSTVALAATTLVSQFTSTLLLWDIRPGVLPGFPRQVKTGIGMSMENYVSGGFGVTVTSAQNYWLAPPPSYPNFAEWASEPLDPPESITDTGPSIRAFLPIDSESDRSALLEFEGMASAFDARVTCIRPTIRDWAFTGSKLYINESSLSATLVPSSFNGTLYPPKLTRDIADVLRHDISSDGYSFNLSVPSTFSSSDAAFEIFSLPLRAGGLINSLSPMQNNSLEFSFGKDVVDFPDEWTALNKENGKSWKVGFGHSFLLIGYGVRGGIPPTSEPSLTLPDNEVLRNLTVKDRGHWLDFSLGSGPEYEKGGMSVTMCYDAINHNRSYRVKALQEFLVSAKRKSNFSEPKVVWDSRDGSFKTTETRAQLGPLNTTSKGSTFLLNPAYLDKTLQSFQWRPDHRFSMGGPGYLMEWYPNETYHDELGNFVKDKNATSETYDFLTETVWKPLFLPVSSSSFGIFVTCHNCSNTTPYPSENKVGTDINPILNTIFLDIMKETDNPALAWQAIVTSVMRTAYYDWLLTFDHTGNATVTLMVPCQKPKYWKGFALVMANLLVHLALVISSSFLFFTRTRYSLLSNAWQVIAQVKAPETELYLDNATMLSDKEVKREIDHMGARRRFNIRRNNEDGRVCFL